MENQPKPLSPDRYYDVIRDTPIVSVDLIVRTCGRVLLGRRKNAPAKGFWFVPGGRVYKDEPLRAAAVRVLKQECGLDVEHDQFEFEKVDEHFYHDNFRDDTFGTHYVSVAFVLDLTPGKECMSMISVAQRERILEQHSDFGFFNKENARELDLNIHPHCKSLLRWQW